MSQDPVAAAMESMTGPSRDRLGKLSAAMSGVGGEALAAYKSLSSTLSASSSTDTPNARRRLAAMASELAST